MAADRRHRNAQPTQPAVQLEEEQRVGELAVGITLHAIVAFLSVGIVPVEVPSPMGCAGGDDNPRAS